MFFRNNNGRFLPKSERTFQNVKGPSKIFSQRLCSVKGYVQSNCMFSQRTCSAKGKYREIPRNTQYPPCWEYMERTCSVKGHVQSKDMLSQRACSVKLHVQSQDMFSQREIPRNTQYPPCWEYMETPRKVPKQVPTGSFKEWYSVKVHIHSRSDIQVHSKEGIQETCHYNWVRHITPIGMVFHTNWGGISHQLGWHMFSQRIIICSVKGHYSVKRHI